ncbi:hypothetical protein ACIQVA_34520 [Streptomyces microflavus]|uniref:hypothetical protein n=1 Tax=Streptomyces microflavus TaxID=1919 RepID=UPI0038304178
MAVPTPPAASLLSVTSVLAVLGEFRVAAVSQGAALFFLSGGLCSSAAEWSDWYQRPRLHGARGHISLAEYESNHYLSITKPLATTSI